jgi:hypothetical protein
VTVLLDTVFPARVLMMIVADLGPPLALWYQSP